MNDTEIQSQRTVTVTIYTHSKRYIFNYTLWKRREVYNAGL